MERVFSEKGCTTEFQWDQVRINELVEYLKRLKLELERGGIRVKANERPFEASLGALDSKKFHAILNSLKLRLSVTQEALDSKIDLNDSKSLFWMAISKMKLRPPLGFLEKLGEEDVFEIYSLENTQLFSNFRFWELVSYPVDEILVREFDYLYKRDSEIRSEIFCTIEKTLALGKIQAFDSRLHTMIEANSQNPREFDMRLGVCAPLWDRGLNQITAFATTVRVEAVR